jgi:hypothetical protein
MIDPWQLPGPARLVEQLVTELLEGHQLILEGTPPPQGLRGALRAALDERYLGMIELRDEPVVNPLMLLGRACSHGIAMSAPHPGMYWVEDVGAARAHAWTDAAVQIAEAARDLEPHARVQLVLALPAGGPLPRAPGIERCVLAPLNRDDLVVAARYLFEQAEAPTWRALHLELAVELASESLPGLIALEHLRAWLGLPHRAVGEPSALADYAATLALPCPSEGMARLALWRAQCAALLPWIDQERLRVVRAGAAWCRVPYVHPATDSTPEKRVEHIEALELAHLCQLSRRLAVDSSERRRLRRMRAARNALSHLEPLSSAMIADLLSQPS